MILSSQTWGYTALQLQQHQASGAQLVDRKFSGFAVQSTHDKVFAESEYLVINKAVTYIIIFELHRQWHRYRHSLNHWTEHSYLTCSWEDAFEKWGEKRTAHCDTCGGQKRAKQDQLDLSTYRKEEEFAEFYDEGTVLPLAQFLESQSIDPVKIGSEAKQRRFIEEDFQPLKCSLVTCNSLCCAA